MMNSKVCLIQDCNNTNIVSRGWCSKHYARFHRNGDPLKVKVKRRNSDDTHYWCPRCKNYKEIKEFHIDINSSSGRHGFCKQCVSKRAKKYWQENGRMLNDKAAAKRFGLTYDEYLALVKTKCQICGAKQNGGKYHQRRLAIDHCHKSNKIRGVLCNNCNRAIGLLKDDADLVLKAANYLQGYLIHECH